MKILIRHAVLLVVPLGLANNAWAICEAEYAVYRDTYQALGNSAAGAENHTRVQKVADIASAQRLSAEDRQKEIARIQGEQERARASRTAADRYMQNLIAANAKLLCVLDATRSSNNSNQNTSNQQSHSPQQQTQQSQQSQQSQQAQQAAQQSQQLAQQNQALADQERQGQRKTNNPAAQAHQCIDVDKDSALFGGFKNSCEYKVNYVFCNFGPKKNSWAEFHDCERKNGISDPQEVFPYKLPAGVKTEIG